ncbi:hypothetical protein [Bifidobacterium sp.]|uniref:hypothetical protein n=1 Tax=Bifidobacterium sp. TaxID=41200 RepID=UPI0025C1BBA4|nr:hypothetical protein [Bifidobacterium sp.]MCH4210130.1 hypothetical protein [Bifidobacterium sp.]MCI1225638.1 hypothetical protein [Bifidobacterium sp.]
MAALALACSLPVTGKPSMPRACACFGAGDMAVPFMFAGVSRHLTMRNAALLRIG